MQEVSYNLSRGMTRILVGKGALETLKDLPDDTIFVYPESLSRLLEGVIGIERSIHYPIVDGEEGKSLDTVLGVLEKLAVSGFKRNSTVVSFGGGTTSDVAGLAASLYMRGMNFISVPTTLLSMVDAAMGGKNAINFHGIKNLVGSFYNPSRTIIDTGLIGKMPPELISEGLGEVAKYALILDEDLFNLLTEKQLNDILSDEYDVQDLVLRCVRDKMNVVEKDEFDSLGKRVVLNFGHTIGHAIEGSSDFSIGHGKAVAYGILLELEIGIKLGLTEPAMLGTASNLLKRLGLPHETDLFLLRQIRSKMMKLIASDKKSSKTTVLMPLPEKIGRAKVCEVELSYISDYLEHGI